MMGGYGGYGGGYGAGGSWLGIGMMLLFGLVLLVGIILLVVWIVRSGGHSGGRVTPPAPGDDACGIAKLRYAKGEITKEQYDEICRTLGS